MISNFLFISMTQTNSHADMDKVSFFKSLIIIIIQLHLFSDNLLLQR